MRTDIAKVLLDGGARAYKASGKGKDRPYRDADDAPRFEATRRGVRDYDNGRGTAPDHYQVAERWIRKQVGRPWAKVTAEAHALCSRRRNWVTQHVLSHSLDQVEHQVDVGKPGLWVVRSNRGGRPTQLDFEGRARYRNMRNLYVDFTGMLCEYVLPKHVRYSYPAHQVIVLDNDNAKWFIIRRMSDKCMFASISNPRRVFDLPHYYGRLPDGVLDANGVFNLTDDEYRRFKHSPCMPLRNLTKAERTRILAFDAHSLDAHKRQWHGYA